MAYLIASCLLTLSAWLHPIYSSRALSIGRRLSSGSTATVFATTVALMRVNGDPVFTSLLPFLLNLVYSHLLLSGRHKLTIDLEENRVAVGANEVGSQVALNALQRGSQGALRLGEVAAAPRRRVAARHRRHAQLVLLFKLKVCHCPAIRNCGKMLDLQGDEFALLSQFIRCLVLL